MQVFYKIKEEEPKGRQLILISNDAELNKYLSSLIVYCSTTNFISTTEITKCGKTISPAPDHILAGKLH